jgi:hypothetical protein
MIVKNEIKDDNKTDISFINNEYLNTMNKILSIEIPKTKVIIRKRPLNQKEISLKEVGNISIIGENKIVLSELKKNLDLSQYMDKKEFIFV